MWPNRLAGDTPGVKMASGPYIIAPSNMPCAWPGTDLRSNAPSHKHWTASANDERRRDPAFWTGLWPIGQKRRAVITVEKEGHKKSRWWQNIWASGSAAGARPWTPSSSWTNYAVNHGADHRVRIHVDAGKLPCQARADAGSAGPQGGCKGGAPAPQCDAGTHVRLRAPCDSQRPAGLSRCVHRLYRHRAEPPCGSSLWNAPADGAMADIPPTNGSEIKIPRRN